MADVARLKKKAAEYETKRQYDRAIGAYEQIVRALGRTVREADVPLFNRLGDLYLRTGNVEGGVAMHEKAVDLYAELGFFNNAIALCNKILRQAPERASIYYKLGKISAKKGFISDAKQNFLEYSARMQKAGQLDEAFRALKEFADLCPDQDDVRLMLAEQLSRAGKPQEALEQLQRLHEQLHGEGRDTEAAATADRIRAIDPSAEPRRASGPVKRMRDDLIFLDLNEGFEGARDTKPLEGLEPTSLAESVGGGFNILTPQEFGSINTAPAPPEREREQRRNFLDGLPLIEDYDPRFLEREAVEKLQTEEFAVAPEPPAREPELAAEAAVAEEPALEPTAPSPDDAEPEVTTPATFDADLAGDAGRLSLDAFTAYAGQAESLPLQAEEPEYVETAEGAAAEQHDSEQDLYVAPAEADEQPTVAADQYEATAAAEEYTEQVDEYTEAADEYTEAADEYEQAADTAERDQFDAAFDALTAEAGEEATEAAEETPAASTEAGAPLRPDDEYVDLGEWLRRVQTPPTTRMIAEEGEIPPEGEQADFEEMLAKFKRGIAQNMDAEDYGSHYDLGVAFREMGLLDEAIAQFQKALRGREHRVATYEALGQCFVDKRQYEVAVTVLQRALREPGFEDERGLGVLYLLGLANERMVRHAEAARYYQRVFAVDVHFRDIAERRGAVAQAAG